MVEPAGVAIHMEPDGTDAKRHASAGGKTAVPTGPATSGTMVIAAKKTPSAKPAKSLFERCCCVGCIDFHNRLKAAMLFSQRNQDELAEQKLKEKKKEWDNKRFYFRVDKLQATFESKLDSCFLEFEFGGQTREEATDEAITKKIKKKKKDKDGKDIEIEGVDVTYKKQLKVIKPRASVFYTRLKKSLKPKETENFVDHSFDGYWKGTYTDLHREYLTIRIWHKRWYGTNVLVGESKESLHNIANSKMDREVRVFKKLPGPQQRLEVVASLRYKCEFSELFEFNINFKDWQIEQKSGELTRLPRYTWLSFQVDRSKASFLDTFLTCMKGCIPCVSNPKQTQLRLLDGSSVNQSFLKYPGTRAWLEDESLRVRLYKAFLCFSCAFFSCRVDSKRVDLQGVLDYGYITADIGKNYWVKGVIDANKVVDRPLPSHRQIGNIDPSAEQRLFQPREKCTYLVVKILRAKGLFIPRNDEFKETLNPSVTIDWLAIRKQSRIVSNSADPFWDDEVYFKIPDKEIAHHRVPRSLNDFAMKHQTSTITLGVWDNDNFAKTPLGYCEVDFAKVFKQRKRRQIVSFASHGHKVDRFVYSSGPMPLKTPFAEGVDFVKHARDEELAASLVDEKQPLVAKEEDDDEKREKEDAGATIGRHIEFQIYFDRVDKKLIPCKDEIKGGKEAKQQDAARQRYKDENDVRPLKQAVINRAEEFWNEALKMVPDRDRRFFPLYGQDEYTGKFYFLPTFVKPIQPPTDLRFQSTLLYFILSIECMRRKEELHPLTERARSIWMWSDPYFFLEKRKGDIKDHAILLCNFLLGMKKKKMDAYVCIGTARQKDPNRPPVPHVWVMTQEERGDERIVRFWETTDGRTYVLDGNRFVKLRKEDPRDDESSDESDVKDSDGEGDDETATADGKTANGLPKESKDEKKPLVSDGDPTEVEDGGPAKRAEDKFTIEARERRAKQRAELRAKKAARAARKAEREAATIGKKELAKAKKAKEELEKKQADARRAENPENSDDDDRADKKILDDAIGALVNPVETKPSAAFSSSDEKNHSKMGVERTVFRHQRNLQRSLAVPGFTTQGQRYHQTPYATIDVVFNHRRMYANLQQPDPEVIKYQLTHRDRWAEFKLKHYREYFGLPKLKPFYTERALVSVLAPQQEVDDLQLVLAQRVQDTISTYRDFKLRMETKFIQRFEFQKVGSTGIEADRSAWDHMQKRLENEFRFGEIKDSGLSDIDEVEMKEYLAELRRDDKDKPEYMKDPRYTHKWRTQIIEYLEPDQIYREQLLHFKHSDSNRISETVLESCKALLETADKARPEFAIAVCIHRLPAMICPVRVLVVCISSPYAREHHQPPQIAPPPAIPRRPVEIATALAARNGTDGATTTTAAATTAGATSVAASTTITPGGPSANVPPASAPGLGLIQTSR